MRLRFSVVLFFLLSAACNQTGLRLPIMGSRTPITTESGGKTVTDTLYHTIPAFHMLDQDSVFVDNNTLRKTIYVADFFFTSCPTTCPVMQRNLLKVAIEYRHQPNVAFVSYSIDPAHDTPHILKNYASRLGIRPGQWLFLTGNRDSVYHLAETGYYVTARADSAAPGGFVHSGALILVDTRRRIRGTYDGTIDDDVQKLSQDIKTLLAEEFPRK